MSRWLEVPEHVTDNPGELPGGFRAAGVACGLKPSGGMDLGLLVCSEPDCVSAARFTRSGVLAAPVVLTKERSRLDAIRVVVANSGNANAATGRRGFEEAARMQGAAAMAGGVREDQVAVASTGVIGVLLDAGEAIRGIARARSELRDYGHGDFSEAIQTTDKFAKEVEVDVALPSGTVRLTAQAKGAGMISPAFATMLCFVQTDARFECRDRRPAARRVRGALVRPGLRRRPALHQRHRDPAGVRRQRRDDRAAVRRRGALRRGARLGAAQARAGHRPRRRGLQADRPRRGVAAAAKRWSCGRRARSRTRRW